MACELSPSAAAFSSMLSAFIGSVFNGLFSGLWVAFFTGWLAWFAVLRILAAGLFEFYITIKTGTNINAGDDNQYSTIGMNVLDVTGTQGGEGRAAHRSTGAEDEEALSQPKQLQRTVTVFGWLGWAWSALYTPISQTIWISVHITSGNGILQVVRALAIAVSALGLTYDYKQRYAASVGRKWGPWAFVTFNMWNSTACLMLGAEAMLLLIHGALKSDSSIPIPLLVIYPIFSIIWAIASWHILPPIDGARPGVNIFADVFMGAFAGVFVAAPAFALWQNKNFDANSARMMYGTSESGLSLREFLKCQGPSFLEKFAASYYALNKISCLATLRTQQK
ncbi:hypothetical protein P154DRAFT_593587 [Amniculicola lignicola CBS 123094]|uniref:Uncharacterized protein n=1 Tax=Amniculicola lignicola CBS 123094 TaxID=1392246 RepID=A0A6A5WKX3_9PLEO|nr:hypothetical protein P154DRAFT_593587 [Amniculicola lignicola CBS 123094]